MESRGPVILIMIVFIALGLWLGVNKKGGHFTATQQDAGHFLESRSSKQS